MFQLYSEPLNLNSATREELSNLYILSPDQISNFLKHREQNGNLISIYELQSIEGYDLEFIHKIIPFVDVEDDVSDNRPLWEKISSEPNNYFLLRESRVLQQRKGFSPPDTNSSGELNQRYLGSPDKLYARYRVSHSKDYSLGLTIEKDAGEQIVFDSKTHRYGMDFVSFHAQFQQVRIPFLKRGKLKNITIGDYQLQFGQSLVLSAGFIVGKGAETITTIRRNNLGIRPYSSALETSFFRGMAATYAIGRFEITGFYSNTRRDASLIASDDTLTQTDVFISSIQTTGFHRTAHEISGKNSISEQIIGSTILYQSKNKEFQSGFSFMQNSYGVPLQRLPTVYNQFEFRGKSNLLIGWNYSYLWQNFNFFGEIARSQSGGIGLVSGFVSSLSSKLEFAMLYRSFDKNFHSIYANAFGENTRTINEKGMYWGLKFTPVRKIIMSAYYDKFAFPWLKFGVDAPSQGYEYLFRLTFKPSKTIILYAQYREEAKEKNQPENTTNLDFLATALRKNYLLNIDYNAVKNIFLRSRVQFSSYEIGGIRTAGYAIIQDFNVDFGKLAFSSRFALFDTEDYNNRQYAYEKDVLYSFSFPAYYGRGLRNYVMIQYALNRKIDIWLRYAQSSMRNQKTISSGLEEIKGNQLSEVKAQLRIKF